MKNLVKTNHMEYQPGMEQTSPEIMDKVLKEVAEYDYSIYTASVS